MIRGDPFDWTSSSVTRLSLGAAFGGGGSLKSVSCPSASYCVAVGGDGDGHVLLVRGSPGSWTTRSASEFSVRNGAGLDSVSCAGAAACLTVGSDLSPEPIVAFGRPQSWSASSFRVVGVSRSSRYGYLDATSCTSSLACLAVGVDGYQSPMFAIGSPGKWNASTYERIVLKGQTWANLIAHVGPISCTAPTSCVSLVGTRLVPNGTLLLLQGNPSKWNDAIDETVGVRMTAANEGLSCWSSGACVALGESPGGRQVELLGEPSHWIKAGSARVLPVAAGLGGEIYLNSVKCPLTNWCAAVGDDGKGQPVTLLGNPATWGRSNEHQVVVPAALGSNGELDSIWCRSETWCVAVGSAGGPLGPRPIVLTGNPAGWRTSTVQGMSVPRLLGGQGTLLSVSCASASACVAVGNTHYYYLDYNDLPIAISGNPAHWHGRNTALLKIPLPTNSTVEGFSTVGGGSGEVGGESGLVGLYSGVVGDYSGIAGAFPGWVTQVSCASASRCLAVGSDNVVQTFNPVIALVNPSTQKLNGIRFRVTSRIRLGSTDSVSCVAGSCEVTGALTRNVNGLEEVYVSRL